VRLVVCLFLSLAVHFILLNYAADVDSVPDLSVSKLQSGTVVRLRTKLSRPVNAVSKPQKAHPKSKEDKVSTVKEQQQKQKVTKKSAVDKTQKERVKRTKKKPISPESLVREEYQNRSQKQPELADRQDYISNPPPPYPDSARRKRQEGTVVLLVEIDAEGLVLAVSIKESSGFSVLDTTAKKTVINWRFSPREDGVGARRVLVPISFRLRR
jgi:protein TonB